MPDYTFTVGGKTYTARSETRLSPGELSRLVASYMPRAAKPKQEYQDRPASKGPIPMASPGWNPPALDEREALGDPTNVMARARSKNPALAQQVFKSSYQSKEPEVEGAINAVKKALTNRPKPKAKKSDFKALTDEKGNRIVGDYDVDTLKRAAADMVERITTGSGNLLESIQNATIGPTPMGYRQGPGRRVGEVAGSMVAQVPDAIFDALIATSPNASIADRAGGALNVAGKAFPNKTFEALGAVSKPVMAAFMVEFKKNPKMTLSEAERLLSKFKSQYEAPVNPKADIPQPGVNMKVGEPTSVPTGRRTRKPGDTTPEAGGKIRLVHYSGVKGLKTLDPSKRGTGPGARMDEQTPAVVDGTWFYPEGVKTERQVVGRTNAAYHTTVDRSKLYDINTDPDGIYANAPLQGRGKYDAAVAEIKARGYDGVIGASDGATPNRVYLFKETPVTEFPHPGAHKPGHLAEAPKAASEAQRAPSDFSDLMIEGYPVGELEKELAHRMYKLAPQPNKLEEVIKEYSRRKWRGNPTAKEIAGRAKQMLAEWKSKHPTPEVQKKLDDDAMAAWQAELERQQALRAALPEQTRVQSPDGPLNPATRPAEAPVPATPTVEPSVTPAAPQRAVKPKGAKNAVQDETQVQAIAQEGNAPTVSAQGPEAPTSQNQAHRDYERDLATWELRDADGGGSSFERGVIRVGTAGQRRLSIIARDGDALVFSDAPGRYNSKALAEAHEVVHGYFSADPASGHRAASELRRYFGGEEPGNGLFEALIDLGRTYGINKSWLANEHPELYRIARNWLGDTPVMSIADANARVAGATVRRGGANGGRVVRGEGEGGVLDAPRAGNPADTQPKNKVAQTTDSPDRAIPAKAGDHAGVNNVGAFADDGMSSAGPGGRGMARRGEDGTSALGSTPTNQSASTNPTGRTDAHNDFYLPDKLAQREPMKMKGKGVIFDSAYDEAALGLQHKDPKVSLAYERAIKGAGLDVNEARTHGAEIARKLKSGEVAPSDYGYRVTEQPLPQREATSQAGRGPVSQEPIAQQPAVTPAAPEPPAAVSQKPPVSQTGKPVETGKPRIISDESYAQARKALLEGGAMMGIEPKKIKAIATIGAYHLENGVRNFKAWSDKMIEEVGEWIRPHLNEAWKASKRAAGEPTTDDLPTNWDHVPVYGGPRVQQPDLAGDFPAGRLADGPGHTEPTPGTPAPTVGENQIKPVQADLFGPEGQELTARKNVPVSTDPLPDLPGTYGGGRVIQGDLEGNFPAGRLADKPGYTPPKPGGEGATTSVERGKKQYSFYFDPNGLKKDKNGLAAIKFPELQKERVRAIRNAIKSIRLLNPVSFINDTTANLANAPVELAVKNTAALLDKAMWGSLRKTQGAASGFITPAMVARSQQGVVKRVAKEVVENFRTGNATDLAKWGVHRTESGKIEAIARARGSSDLWARDLWHRLTREEMKRANPRLTDPQIESIALEEELKSVFANESWGSKLVSSLEGKLDTEELQALGIVFDQIVPFPKILANVSGRVTDFTPLGFVKAMGKYYQGRKSGFTLADRRNINELVSRGLIGTAGLYIGMKRYQAGNLHPDEINPQTGQTFWPNLTESGLGPWGKVMTLGAQFGIALDPRMNFTESERKRLLTGTIMDAFDQPAAGAVTKASSIMSPVTGADSIGGLAGKLATSPVAPLRNFATAKDWADVRKMFIGIQPRDEKRPKGFVETVKGALPGLRSQLPDRGMPHPELGKYAVVYKPAVAKKIDGVTVEKPEQLAKREAVRRDMLKRFIDQVSSSPNYKALGVKEKRALLQAITHNILTESFLKADADRRTEIIQKSLERALRPKQ